MRRVHARGLPVACNGGADADAELGLSARREHARTIGPLAPGSPVSSTMRRSRSWLAARIARPRAAPRRGGKPMRRQAIVDRAPAARRAAHALSQTSSSQRLPSSPGQRGLSKLKRQKRRQPRDTIVGLSRAIGVSLSTLFKGTRRGGGRPGSKRPGMEVVPRNGKGHTYHLRASEGRVACSSLPRPADRQKRGVSQRCGTRHRVTEHLEGGGTAGKNIYMMGHGDPLSCAARCRTAPSA